MVILAHRGYWKDKSEHNAFVAFRRALQLGFGIETDIRDQAGELVISHDMPVGKNSTLREFLALHRAENPDAWLAINLKSTELADSLHQIFAEHQVKNYFLFDSAIPDSLKLIRRGLPVFTRHSDIEPQPALYDLAQGIWLDEMLGPWISETTIQQHIKSGKRVCSVSPELHGRSPDELWKIYRKLTQQKTDELLMICTDAPENFQEFIDG